VLFIREPEVVSMCAKSNGRGPGLDLQAALIAAAGCLIAIGLACEVPSKRLTCRK